jgi:hypothetical protein
MKKNPFNTKVHRSFFYRNRMGLSPTDYIRKLIKCLYKASQQQLRNIKRKEKKQQSSKGLHKVTISYLTHNFSLSCE